MGRFSLSWGLLFGLLTLGCDKPGTDDEAASGSETGTSETGTSSESGTSSETGTTTGEPEPDPCEGLEPSLPLFAGDATYSSGQISISSCEFLISVIIGEDLLVEGTDVDLVGDHFHCGCGDEWDCGYDCSGPTRVVISHVDEHCVVGTLNEAGGGDTGTDSGTDSGDTGADPSCVPPGGFVIRR